MTEPGVLAYRRNAFNPFAGSAADEGGGTTPRAGGAFTPRHAFGAAGFGDGGTAVAAANSSSASGRGDGGGDSGRGGQSNGGGGSAIVVAGVDSDVGLHFIRLLNESPDFAGLPVRGLVLVNGHGFDAQRDREAVVAARRRLDDFCGEDTAGRVALLPVAFCSTNLGGSGDATVGGGLSAGSMAGLRPGLLTRADCLHPPTLRAAMGHCAYVVCCGGRELRYGTAIRSALAGGDEAHTSRRLECGAVASLLSEAARVGAAQFLLLSSIHVLRPRSLPAMFFDTAHDSVLRWKLEAERLARSCAGLPYTVARLGGLEAGESLGFRRNLAMVGAGGRAGGRKQTCF
eukprot:SAG22_NODE_281_length_13064_cov_13.367605_3_plen_344_part_00